MDLARTLRRLLNSRLLPLINAKKHSSDLASVQDNTDNIKSNDIILFCTLRNEDLRIPFLLEYYRKMGVGHFCFVDNDSEDGFQVRVRDQADCSVWHTSASYKDSNFGERGADLIRLAAARCRGRSSAAAEEEVRQAASAAKALRATLRDSSCLSVDQLALDGRDLIRMGLKPGPRFGEILDALLDLVIEDPERNETERLETVVREEIAPDLFKEGAEG